jgi:hypothetical protein
MIWLVVGLALIGISYAVALRIISNHEDKKEKDSWKAY